MPLLNELMVRNGNVSSQYSKQIAQEILAGKVNLIKEAIPLLLYKPNSKKDKNVRIAAACIIDFVAKERPDLINPYLKEILPALEINEPQTRWIAIRTIGNCASLNPEIAKKAIPFANKYIHDKKDGELCLLSSTDLFLAEYGSISKEKTNEVFPLLIESTNYVIPNEHDWLIEAFIKISQRLDSTQKKLVLDFADDYKNHPRKATQSRIKKLLKNLE